MGFSWTASRNADALHCEKQLGSGYWEWGGAPGVTGHLPPSVRVGQIVCAHLFLQSILKKDQELAKLFQHRAR